MTALLGYVLVITGDLTHDRENLSAILMSLYLIWYLEEKLIMTLGKGMV